MLLIGLGLGQLMQTLTIASQNSVGLRDMGVATSASTFFRQIGGTLGTAVLLSLLFTILPANIQASLSDAPTLHSALDAAITPAVASAPENKAIMGLIYTNIVTPLESSAQQAAHTAGVQALVAQGVPQAEADAKVPAQPLDFSKADGAWPGARCGGAAGRGEAQRGEGQLVGGRQQRHQRHIVPERCGRSADEAIPQRVHAVDHPHLLAGIRRRSTRVRALPLLQDTDAEGKIRPAGGCG